jgi:Ca-activated chloride channel family protein
MSDFFEHFRFAQPGWLLLLLPALLLLVLRRGRGASAAVVFPNLPLLVSLGRRMRERAWNLGLPLAWAALVFAIVALARPVWRNEYESRTASGIDIVVAFDVSLSMKIDDFTEAGRHIQRLDVAKAVVDDFISRRPDDRIGLVIFAGQPYPSCPITLDHNWLRSRLNEIELGQLDEQGTAIGSALAAASGKLDARDAKSKIIILITDGASNSGKISPIEAAEHAKTLGIKIYTVAIGTPEGRVDVQRFPRQEFDIPTLAKIAEITGAEHQWAQNLETLRDTFQTIDRLEKSEARRLLTVEDTELFAWFAGAAALFTLAAAVRLALTPPPSP